MSISSVNYLRTASIQQDQQPFLPRTILPNNSDYDDFDSNDMVEMQAARRSFQLSQAPQFAMDSTHVRRQKSVPPLFIIPAVWVGLSVLLVLFNKYIFSTLNFPYPLFLTAFHMMIATLSTSLIRAMPTEGLQVVSVDISWLTYLRTVVPLSIFFSISLVLGNMAYVHLSVSFVQMLKSLILLLTLVIQLVARLQAYSHYQMFIIIVSSVGCYIAASGEVQFDMFGFACQISAVVAEAARLVLVEVMLKDHKLDPLSSIALYAPLCLVFIGCMIPFLEGALPIDNLYKVGVLMLLVNGLVALLLNVASVFVIQSVGSVVLSMSGVVKDILLIGISAIFMGSHVSLHQVLGYSLSASALMLFRVTGGKLDSPAGQVVVYHAERVVSTPMMLFQRAPRLFLFLAGVATVAVLASSAVSWNHVTKKSITLVPLDDYTLNTKA
ncbi:triose-phosphate transporter family-domain-containing protein [Naematelia encephala]|uniref:Triose-phosphate transporter family-domain-containing protein n=1 Tax=Naematelia encephala TaxID=71784 RepID=A0A1Y2ASD0_9TREE|nr:triose-phosphate transporter family-domain-containing protein [Naematelia encephala]